MNTPTPWATFRLASLAVFLVSLDATIGFAAFPALSASFSQASYAEVSWVLTAYAIVYAALLVPAGRLADLLGRKRLFLIGVALFSVASGLCGLATELSWLIGCRVLQAVGAALLTPTSLALILDAFPAEKRTVVVGLWGAVGALAAALGPSVGALIIQASSWHWVFLLNVPVGLLAWLRARKGLVESSNPSRGGLLDIPGIVVLIAAVALLVLGVTQMNVWAAPYSQGTVAAGLLLLVVLYVWARRRPHAVLDFTLFNDRNYRYVNLATFVFGVAFTAMFLGFFLFMTSVWDYSLIQAGLGITPGPLLVIPVAVISGKYAARYGYRPLLVLGGVCYALCGLWFYVMVSDTANYWAHWLPGMLLSGLGVGLVLPALSGAAAACLDANRFAVGCAVNVAVRQFGSAIGVALSVALIGSATPDAQQFQGIFLLLIAGGLLTALLTLAIRQGGKEALMSVAQ